jgi:crotonobetainyl-CoA:carnitine CoA-transferase CaiB-like acyl-CoA transferase
MLLGDLGATITKVERPGSGDDTRSWGPPYGPDGEATYFQAVNRNKSSIWLDLRSPEGQAEARALAAESDVVVENFRPGVMEGFGLGYDDLVGDNPGLVYCSITGFGRGAGARLPGYDLLIQAVGGLMSITGSPEGEPQKVGVAVVDVLAGLFASVGILAALRYREASGEGQRVEVDLMSSLLAGLVNQGSAYTIGGSVAGRMGNQHPSIAPYELLPTADGRLVLAVGTDAQFAALCEVLELPRLVTDPRFATNSARVEHRVALRTTLCEALAAMPATWWAERLAEVRVPAGVVNDIAQAFALATSLGLDPIVQVGDGDGREVPLTKNPIGLSRTPPEYRLPPPARRDGSGKADEVGTRRA